jgi:hypothetical protein
MARLDAAARFTPALTKLATDAACEPATTVDAQIVRSAVTDRENAADEARSRFSMISDKSVFSHRKMSIDGASHEALGSTSDTEIDVRNRILAGNFGGKAPSRPEVMQILEPVQRLSGSRNPRYSGRQIVSSLQLENKQLATASAGSEKTPAEDALRHPRLPTVGCSSEPILSRFQRESVNGLSECCEDGDY